MTEDDRPVVNSLDEFLEFIELGSIRFNELSIRRLSGADSDASGDDEQDDDAPQPDVSMFPEFSDTGDRLRLRVRLSYRSDEAELDLEVQMGYVLREPIAPPATEIMADFLGRSAMLTATPHLREAMLAASGRIGVALPLIQLYRPSAATPYERGGEVADTEPEMD